MTTIAFRPPTGSHAGARGPAFGLGISLLVHAGVLAWLMHALAPLSTSPADDKPAAPMQIRLETARPVQPETPAAAAAAPAQAASVRPAAPARPASRPLPRRQAGERATTPAPAPASETPDLITSRRTSAPDLFAVPQAAPSEPGPDTGPAVDLDAARREARRIAREASRNLVSLPARKPVTDPNEGRPADVDPLEKARRSDCKSAYAGMGLLAVIPLAKDAITGTGCKW